MKRVELVPADLLGIHGPYSLLATGRMSSLLVLLDRDACCSCWICWTCSSASVSAQTLSWVRW